MKNNRTGQNKVLMNVKSLKKYFPITKGFFHKVVGHTKAVDGVSFKIYEGESLGLVGESGCGKTTLGRAMLRLIEPTEGKALFRANDDSIVDITAMELSRLRPLRRQMAMIFQDPYSSLNPRLNIRNIVGEPLIVCGLAKGRDLDKKVGYLLELVNLPAQCMRRYPNEFSCGQRQRIGIARALALNPRLIVADEPVSALDVSVQAQVLNLLQDLKKEFGLTYLFIAHDLSVVEYISDRIAVMYLGKIVELAGAEELCCKSKHPYTEALISAVPTIGPKRGSGRIVLKGDVSSFSNLLPGCRFHPRCQYAIPLCSQKEPSFEKITPESNHWVACHLAKKLSLKGAKA